ncbi:MAG: SDR family oxidoreductase [Capnocytophaga sp.]|nr:SDR family oxidoreductase [Capnocytophaga sp.]
MSKKIIITGTSRGIGIELVKQFSAAGHDVLALSRHTEPLEKLGLPNVDFFPFDITSDESLERVRRFVQTEWQQADILINNAGMLVNKPFEQLTTSDFQKVYEVNVYGVARLIQTVIAYMPAGSHVVNISSMGGVQGSLKFAGLAAYSSSKGAVITLTELLAEEYKAQQIAFNVLALGAVQTEMLEEAFPGYQASTTPHDMATYITDFALNGQRFFNGKLIQVSNSTP